MGSKLHVEKRRERLPDAFSITYVPGFKYTRFRQPGKRFLFFFFRDISGIILVINYQVVED